MPTETKKSIKRRTSGGSNNEANLNNILNLHLDSLPKIEKKKLKMISDRNKSLKAKRVASSLNSQKLF